ncbi:MAG: NAD-dependent deacylase [Bacteroidales bacterium]|nr:NAD-dependent deacylase [Bacteroidales bacterium]
MENKIKEVVELIKNSKRTTAFTGAGISVESGIPPFRGEGGLWNKYDPIVLDLNYFFSNPRESWSVIKEIFYDFFGTAKFNRAHEVLAEMEKQNYLSAVITQNIDNLHQEAGSKVVHEFHGNSKTLICTSCNNRFPITDNVFKKLPPKCEDCGSLLKPDFIFFGEGIPQQAYQKSIEAAQNSDVFIVIGSTGEVMPASQMPVIAKQNGATIIEINPNTSNYTSGITDIFLQGKAGEVLDLVMRGLE